MKPIGRFLRFHFLLIASLALTGCAARQAPIRVDLEIPTNPSTQRRVHIAEVVDQRQFTVSGEDPVPHQLATDGLEDPAITARCIAQLRTASGRPMRDFLLPKGKSASSLTREALTRAFRESGFVVVEPGDTGFAGSTPVAAEIIRFWSWNTGSWTFTFHFESVVLITAAVAPFEQGRQVRGEVRLHSAVAASERSFRNTTTKGLNDFIENVRRELTSPR